MVYQLLAGLDKIFNLSETAYYYFFSSTAQSMAAIIAISGSVAIFKYSTLLSEKRDMVIKCNKLIKRGELVSTIDETYKDIEKKILENLSIGALGKLNQFLFEIKRLEELIKNYKRYFLRSIVLSVVIFIMSLALIPFSRMLSENKYGILTIEVVLLLIGYASINIVKYFKEIIV